jgi:hypothetical protein
MLKSSLFLSLIFGGALASELASRIVVPLPKLMKYSEAAAACESEGMQLVRFTTEENVDYAAATMVEKNLDRVWIGAMGADERKKLAMEVFEGQPIVFKVEQIEDEEKMLAVLCEPNFSTVKPSLEESLQNLDIEVVKSEDETDLDPVTEKDDDRYNTEPDVIICKFEVDQEEKSVQVIEGDDNGIDLVKSKGGLSRYRYRRSSRCSRSSSSSDCERSPRRRHYRHKGHGGYTHRHRRSRGNCSRSSSSTSCSSSSSSSCPSSSSSSSCANSFDTCSDNFSCSPFDPTGSSSSSSSKSKCKNSRPSCRRKPKRRSRKSNIKSSSSSSSSSSSEDCGTGLCRRNSKRFFREIHLTQRIH